MATERYILNSSKGELILDGNNYNSIPIGWSEKKINLSRSQTYTGILQKVSVDLTFIHNGYKYLKELYDNEGILAYCQLKIQYFNISTHSYITKYTGEIDFSTKKEIDSPGKGITFNILDTSFANKLFSRENIEIRYDKLETLDGEVISPFGNEFHTVSVLGQAIADININSTLTPHTQYQTNGAPRNFITPIVHDIVNESYQDINVRFFGGSLDNITSITGSDCWYFAKIQSEISFNFQINYKWTNENSVLDVKPNSDLYIRFYKAQFNSDGSVILPQTPVLLGSKDFSSTSDTSPGGTIIESSYSGTISTTLSINEGVYLWMYFVGVDALGLADTQLEIKTGSTLTSEYSQQNSPTNCKFALPFEIFTRLTESITNSSLSVQSSFFGRTDSPIIYDQDGAGSLFGNTNGYLLRQFTEDESQLSFKFKDYFQNLEKIWNIGLGVEKNNGNPYIIIEDKKYFFNDNVILELDTIEADSFSRELSTDYFYSDIEVGYARSVAEEVSGLLEYNNKLDFNTYISNVENKLDLISGLVAGGYPIEFTRAKDKTNYSTEDTEYDNANFIMSLYRDGGGFIQKTTETYDSVDGIPLVKTPINLDITPQRNTRRWGWMLRNGLEKYLDKKIKLNKAQISTNLSTLKTDELYTVTENSDIDPQELDNPLFSGHIVKFNAPISLDTFELIETNLYGLIKYPDPIAGEVRYGWIQELNTNPVDRETNYVLIEALSAVEVLYYLLTETGGYLLQEDGSKIIL